MERLRLEEKLNQSERLAHLGTMIATVSHEIKSPLGIVRSTGEILAKRIEKFAPGNEHLAKIIVDETIRLNSIVVEFLDFARPQKLNFKPYNLNLIVGNVLSFVAPELKRKNIELVTDLAPDLQENDLDKDMFYRALLNIFINALQAIGEGGSIQVSTHNLTRGGTQFSLRDSGGGMSEEKMTQIFKPFFTDKNKGTGLGLAITKNIVDSHGAEISVKSKIGNGTTFTINIPPTK